MQITRIRAENDDGTAYTVSVNGRTWQGVMVGSRYWEPLQAAITGGATVTPFPSQTLAGAKAEKIDAIDRRTRELIEAGFTYDGSSFSMSEIAQRNWAALAAAHGLDMLTFPMTISTVDEGSYELSDAAACLAFLGAYMTYQTDSSQPLGAGRVLKAQVNAAATVEAVEDIEDTR